MHIIDLMDNKKPFVSLEFFPPKDQTLWPKFFEIVEKLKIVNPLFVSVAYFIPNARTASAPPFSSAMCRSLKNLIWNLWHI